MLHKCFTCNQTIQDGEFFRLTLLRQTFESMRQMDLLELRYFPENAKDSAMKWVKAQGLTQEEEFYVMFGKEL